MNILNGIGTNKDKLARLRSISESQDCRDTNKSNTDIIIVQCESVSDVDSEYCEYVIDDEAAQKNEAQEKVDKANGTITKSLLGELTKTCVSKNAEMLNLSGKIGEYAVTIADIKAVAGNLNDEIAGQIIDIEKYSQKIKEEIAKIREEINVELNKIKAEQSKGRKADQSVIEASKKKYGDLVTKIDGLNLDLKNASEIHKSAVEKKAKTLSGSQDKLNASMKDMANKAIDANEYADVTIEAGNKVIKYNVADLQKNGWGQWVTTKSSDSWNSWNWNSWNNQEYYIDAKGAQYEGYQAIAVGEQLGGSSQNVLSSIKAVGTGFGIGVGSAIENILNKTYVDTSALGDIQEFKTDYNLSNGSEHNFYGFGTIGTRGTWGDISNIYKNAYGSTWYDMKQFADQNTNRENQNIYNSNLDIFKNIANASANKNKA